jgi:thiamine biosynthesis lipoprotein
LFKYIPLLTSFALWSCGTESPPLVVTGQTMGTTYTIQVVDAPPELSAELLRDLTEKRLAQINSVMSTFDSEAEISRFNRNATTDWIGVSESLYRVVTFALEVSNFTDGAFDITAAPLINMWGFGPTGVRFEPPDKAEISRLLEQVGYGKIETHDPPYEIRKTQSAVTIDLSAIAKGYGVDEIAHLLASQGSNNFLVEIGGEVRAAGLRADGAAWQVGVENPVSGPQAIAQIITLSDASIATSGDYRNFFEHDGRRYSHTIDTRTGYPVEHKLALVSVVARSTMQADAYATALLALGPELGYELALAQGIAAMFIVRKDDGFTEKATPGFIALRSRL